MKIIVKRHHYCIYADLPEDLADSDLVLYNSQPLYVWEKRDC